MVWETLRSNPRKHDKRPYVLLNSAMSVDGKIATVGGESRLSSPADLKRVHAIRASVDGIMVGIGTVLVDDPKLTVKFVRGPNPTRVIVDSRARTPPTANVVISARQVPTIIAVTSRAPLKRVSALERAGANVLVCGNGSKVSLPILLGRLQRMGIKKILLEGGGTLNWSMVSRGYVDEVTVAISPKILGGARAKTLADGEGVARIRDAVRLRYIGAKKYGTDIVVRYGLLT
ncbi:2,5-diamino-6-(ribosylamino)-4(3H)-pyrimidinone 5'-phosphate reductase [Candidatus Bathyarchaeota archaeon]|nr:MAG: 2,5-diamino-6-(ribosylamino)-4(3H)-pyrimidinone 5'-phosphate reductase [Candidatus Bathyarchaeota archaeon]TMI31893.1 MAG: 2,5-diamino-6-(ribosylamino)-4(3H)-pyrimidinone 5'-phosphate reductase [Candidatus Bathyarchaeota archaeon]